jgi:hypothetical protein
MRVLSIVVSVTFWLLTADCAFANVVPPMSLELQHAQADLVVVGRLGQRATCSVGVQRLPCAEILTDVVLKGPPGIPTVRRYLVLFEGIEESRIDDMVIVGRALIFMTRGIDEAPDAINGPRELYLPVRGRQSILELR